MTADRRLRVGGWAALVVAIVAPLQVIAIVIRADADTVTDPWTSPSSLFFDVLRLGGLLIAVIGLDRLFRSNDPVLGRRVLAIGTSGAALGLAVTAWIIAVGDRAGGAPWIELVGDLLVACWFIGGGLVLLGSGRQLARIGWTALIGGAGQGLTALSVAATFGGTPGVTGTALIDWFLLMGLFVVIYLVRVWSYVVRGRLPGPGVV